MRESLRLEYGGFAVRVLSREPSHLTWLAEFLSPWFSASLYGGGDVHSTVTLRTDRRVPHLLATARSLPEPPRIDTFVLDSRIVRHPVVRQRNGGRLIVDEELHAFYSVSNRGIAVRILSCGNTAAARVALMRVVRELAMARTQNAGRWLLHCAAVAIDGRAIAVAGPKRSGKTTMLLGLLRRAGARFIANDRAFVDLQRSPPQLIGLPSIVNLRAGTLALFPKAAALADARGFKFWETREENRRSSSQNSAAGLDVSPVQLCELAGVEPCAEAPLAAILLPSREPHDPRAGSELHMEPLDAATTAHRLRESVFGGIGARHSEAFGDPLHEGSRRAADEFCRVLAETVPAFDGRVGMNATTALY